MPFPVLLLCFVLSGFAALLYETVWARQFAVVFGSGELASVSILAAYMGGLAVGSSLASRAASRIERPLLAYGVLEGVIALGALAVPLGITAVNVVYTALFGGLPELPTDASTSSSLFNVVSSFLVVLPCTAAMGATLPLLVRHAVARDDEIGVRTGTLYAANTVGAIAGALAAGLWLMPAFGLQTTVRAGIAVNLFVFAIVAFVSRGRPEGVPSESDAARDGPRWHWVELAMLVSGAISFTHEAIWIRLLGFVLGGSTAAFATMLAGFLAGIALGSAASARFATDRARARLGFIVSQLGAAVTGRAVFELAEPLVEAASAGAGEPAIAAGLAALTMLPLTLCLGATFPFAVRILAAGAASASRASARVYAWNTVGSIAGSIGSAFVLLPTFGLIGTVEVATFGSLSIAGFAAIVEAPRPRRAISLAALVLVAGLVVRPEPPWTLLRHSVVAGGPLPGEVTYYGVGRSGTVLLFDQGPVWLLAANGRPEASIARPEMPPAGSSLSRWLAMVPVLLRPETERMLVIGLGGGQTLAAVPRSVDQVDVIELEEEIVRANRAVAARAAEDPFADPRVGFHVGDARGLLRLTGRTWDAIVSQPSHPWSSGASHLYTREFFSLVKERLTADGVFVQWIGLPFADEALVRTLVATLASVYDHVELYRPNTGSLLFVASDASLDPFVSADRAIRADPDTFGLEGIDGPEEWIAARILASADADRLAGGATINTDDTNVLVGTGPHATELAWFDALVEPLDPLHRGGAHLDPVRLARRRLVLGDRRGASRVADGSRAEMAAAAGWLALDAERRAEAKKLFEAALSVDPGVASARQGAALTGLALQGDVDPALLDLEIASQAAARLDWDTVAGLDASLATWAPGDAAFVDALRLRVEWRIASSNPRDGEAALALVDAALARRPTPYDYLLRVHAARLAGLPKTARATVQVLEAQPGPAAARYAAAARALLGDARGG